MPRTPWRTSARFRREPKTYFSGRSLGPYPVRKQPYAFAYRQRYMPFPLPSAVLKQLSTSSVSKPLWTGFA